MAAICCHNKGIQRQSTDVQRRQAVRKWYQDLYIFIVNQTNLNANKYITAKPNSYLARPFEWKPITVSEHKSFLGLLWSYLSIHHMPVFSVAMVRKRYAFQWQYPLSPSGVTLTMGQLHKIGPLINYLPEKFADVHTPQQNIRVDESLIHFTGKLAIKRYLPRKHCRYVVKWYKLCERATGYTYWFFFGVYEGKGSDVEPSECPDYMRSSGKIV